MASSSCSSERSHAWHGWMSGLKDRTWGLLESKNSVCSTCPKSEKSLWKKERKMNMREFCPKRKSYHKCDGSKSSESLSPNATLQALRKRRMFCSERNCAICVLWLMLFKLMLDSSSRLAMWHKITPSLRVYAKSWQELILSSGKTSSAQTHLVTDLHIWPFSSVEEEEAIVLLFFKSLMISNLVHVVLGNLQPRCMS